MTDMVYKRDDYLSWKMEIENNNSFNRTVYDAFKKLVNNKKNLKIVDIGNGCGGLIQRLIGLNAFKRNQDFIGIDIDKKLLSSAVLYMQDWANRLGYTLKEVDKRDSEISAMIIQKGKTRHSIKFYETSVYDSDKILEICGGKTDIIMGNTVFEHLNAEIALKSFKKYLKDEGIIYLPVNAEHDLIMRPVYIDKALEEKIIDGFMDFHFDGLPDVEFEGKSYKTGDRCCGRNMLHNFVKGGFDVLAYGGSEKIIRSTVKRKPYYKDHEIKYMTFFLDNIFEIAKEKGGDLQKIEDWRKTRQEHLENGELYMILRQMDLLAVN